MDIIITLAAGGIGGILFYRLKAPGGMMIGAVIGSLLMTLLFPQTSMPYLAKFTAQVVAGTFIGCSIDRDDLKQLKGAYQIVLTVVVSFFLLNLLTGLLLYWCTPLDLLTSMLCTVPGGMSDVPLAAADMGADVSAVVVLQFTRLCSGVGLFPMWIAICIPLEKVSLKSPGKVCTEKLPLTEQRQHRHPVFVAFTLLLGAVCGALGRWLGVPAGPLLFSMIGTLLLNLLVTPVSLPKPIKRCAQVLSGTYIGCSVPHDSLPRIPQLLIPALCVIAAFMINAVIVGKWLQHSFGVSRREGMLMLTPAGASDMVLISADIGVESTTLVLVHIVRMLFASSVFPQIWYALSHLIE